MGASRVVAAGAGGLCDRPMSDSLVDALARVPLLSTLNRRHLTRLARELRERTWPAGAVVVEEGASGVGFFLVLDGEADVSAGGAPRGTLRAGDHFGEIELLTDRGRSATVTARTELRTAGLVAWGFRPFVLDNPEVGWTLLQTMAERMRGPNRATARPHHRQPAPDRSDASSAVTTTVRLRRHTEARTGSPDHPRNADLDRLELAGSERSERHQSTRSGPERTWTPLRAARARADGGLERCA